MTTTATTTTDTTDPLFPDLSSSSSTSSQTAKPPSPLCTICRTQSAKYTCPRCATRTCSLPCSTSHKNKTGCSGERDKVAYVPMNRYGWGAMMDDYVFLEETGRKVAEWGKEIVGGGFGMRGAAAASKGAMVAERMGRGRGRGGGRGRGRGGGDLRGNGGDANTKRDVLRRQLEGKDVEMELLSPGMARRKLNQSSWDFKKQTAFLTIEFKFYPPNDPLAPSSQSRPPPYVLITHRNNISTPLLALIQSHISDRSKSKKDTIPTWTKDLLFPDAADPESFTPPEYVMKAPRDPLFTHPLPPRPSLANPTSSTSPSSSASSSLLSSSIAQVSWFAAASTSSSSSRTTTTTTASGLPRAQTAAYYQFDATQPLGTLLRNTRFVEFPTIEVWPRDEFRGSLVVVDKESGRVKKFKPKREEEGGRGGEVRDYDDDSDNDSDNDEGLARRPAKRRKVNVKAGKKAIKGLLGGYGSEEDEDEEFTHPLPNGLELLGDYAESEEEPEPEEVEAANSHLLGGEEDAEGDTDDEIGMEMEPAALLELVRQVQGRETWTEDVVDHQELVDWGDSEEEV